MEHRGPDDQGTFEATSGDVRVELAFTRLAILDLSPAGHQPMSTEGGRFTIVYNGEVYNYREIRAELVALGESFRSATDTEVVLKAYARWGKGCVKRLRGMFAFAIWDAARQSVCLVRDRSGIKPLYYAERPGSLAFASEVRTLLATGLAERTLSRRALSSYLSFGSVYDPDTILEGVRSLPPAMILEYHRGKISCERYWSLPTEITEPGPATLQEAAASIRPVLEEAVRLRLIADVPVGIFLSGGIDSSVLAALAASATTGAANTFTVTFDETAYSEAPFAAEVARLFGCNHHQVHLTGSQAASEIEQAVGALDQPSCDGINTYFVAKAAKASGLTVALSGLGGDEVFAGYSTFRSFGSILAAGRATRSVAPLFRRVLHKNPLNVFGSASSRERKLFGALSSGGAPVPTYALLRAVFTPDQVQQIIAPEMGAALPPPPVSGLDGISDKPDPDSIDPVNLYSALELSNYLQNTLLRDTDAMSMRHALEVRVPLLDHVLIEQILRIPGHIKMIRGQSKPLLTAAVPALPRHITGRSKMGFTLPFTPWLRGPLRPFVDSVLLGEPTRRLGALDPSAVASLWRIFLERGRSVTYARVWALVALAFWCDKHRITA
jgi:asparagine synthase (glutamine-hydrolysing)